MRTLQYKVKVKGKTPLHLEEVTYQRCGSAFRVFLQTKEKRLDESMFMGSGGDDFLVGVIATDDESNFFSIEFQMDAAYSVAWFTCKYGLQIFLFPEGADLKTAKQVSY